MAEPIPNPDLAERIVNALCDCEPDFDDMTTPQAAAVIRPLLNDYPDLYDYSDEAKENAVNRELLRDRDPAVELPPVGQRVLVNWQPWTVEARQRFSGWFFARWNGSEWENDNWHRNAETREIVAWRPGPK